MPAAVPAVIAAASAAGTTATVAAGVSAAAVAAGTAATIGAIGATLLSSAGSLALSTAANVLLRPALPGSRGGMQVGGGGPTAARNIIYGQVRMIGDIIFRTTSNSVTTPDKENTYLHIIYAFAGHEVEEIGDIYFDDEVLPLEDISDVFTGAMRPPFGYFDDDGVRDFVRIKKYTGAYNQDLSADLQDGGCIEIGDKDQFRGIACIYVRLRWRAEVWTRGVPQISAVIKGRKVYDPREVSHDPDDPDTWAYSTNAVLCQLDWMRGVPMRAGDAGDVIRPYGFAADDDRIDMTLAGTEATIADENVDVLAGGAEDRYTLNGVVSSAVLPFDAMRQMLTATMGECIFSGGLWRLTCASYKTPTVTLTEDDCAGAITYESLGSDEVKNWMRGVHFDALQFQQPVDIRTKQNATYLSDDGGRTSMGDIELPYTTSRATAQRLAKIALEESRRAAIVRMVCKLTAMRLRAGDTIMVTNSRRSWTSKVFKVKDWQLVVSEGGDGGPSFGIELLLKEHDSAIYTWTHSTDEIPPDGPVDADSAVYWFPATPGSTFQVPSGGWTSLEIRAKGGGGGGALRSSTPIQYGGGEGGESVKTVVLDAVNDIGKNVNITVGTGGAGRTTTSGNGTAGGNTTVTTSPLSGSVSITCNGGGGGNTGSAGAGGTATGGDTNTTGETGRQDRGGGDGGGNESQDATKPGCGGGAGIILSGTPWNGGDGAAGYVLLIFKR